MSIETIIYAKWWGGTDSTLSLALKANDNDKELIKGILNNSTLKISDDFLGHICNIGDSEIVDMFLELIEKISMFISFEFDNSWKKWNKDILNKVLKSPKIANNTGKLEVIEIISKHLQSPLDSSIESHQESSNLLLPTDINEYTNEIHLMGDLS